MEPAVPTPLIKSKGINLADSLRFTSSKSWPLDTSCLGNDTHIELLEDIFDMVGDRVTVRAGE